MAHDTKFLRGNEEDDWKSRSQKKRESTAMQKTGEELVSLAPAVLDTLNLPAELLEAILECQNIKDHEGRRRQMQYVGRLMREVGDDNFMDEIDIKLAQLKSGQDLENEKVHQIENIRTVLLAKSEKEREKALKDLMVEYPELERTKLAKLIENTLAERENTGKSKPPKAFRELFKYLRSVIAK